MSRSGRLEWVRIDTNIDEHPQIIAAGFEGSTVFQLCIRVSGAFGLGGHLHGFYRSPVFLARRLGTTPHFVEVGIAKCLEVELLINDGDDLVIPTIARFNGSDTARKQEYRANKINALPTNVPDNPGQSRTVPVMSQVVPYDTNGTVRDGTNKTNEQVSTPTESLAPSPRKAKAPKHDKPALNMETWEWVNLTPDIRQAWSQDYPAIDIDDELRKARAWVRADPTRKKTNWQKFLANWFSRAQDKGGSKHAPADFRAIERAAEREWQRVMQAGASNDYQKIGFAVAMLHPRTVAALKVIDKDPANAVWRMADIPLREQLTYKAAFIPAWKASGIPYEVEE